MTASPLGISQPDLTVTGFSAPVAAWGGPFSVTVDVQNLGTSATIQPLSLETGAVSPADSTPTQIAVFLTAGRGPRAPRVLIGAINVPAVPQNSLIRLTANFDRLPDRPPGFPDAGGEVFVSFAIDPGNDVADLDRTNNAFAANGAVRIVPRLPDVAAITLDLPPVIQPGDVVAPTVQIANFGGADIATQAPINGFLVASTDPTFRRGVVVVDRFRVEGLNALSEVPQRRPVLGDVNLQRPLNVATLQAQRVRLPTFAPSYFLSVAIDPRNQTAETGDFGRRFRTHGLSASSFAPPVRRVGPPIPGLPPAGILTEPSSQLSNPFPFPSFPVRPLPQDTPLVPSDGTNTTTTGTA